MFFILSKLLHFLVHPLNWFIFIFGYALLTKKATRRFKLLRGGFWLYVILTNPLIFNRVGYWWECPPTAMSSLKDTFDVAVVLGGFSNLNTYATDERLNLNQAGNRLTDAVQLYKKGLVKKILVTGGDGKLFGKSSKEATAAEPFLLSMGVQPDAILLESESRNTYENALFTKQLLEKQAVMPHKIFLITSAYHIYRSVACFRKIGLDVTPFSAHFEAETLSWQPSKWLIPNNKNFYRWEHLFKEWIGCIAYKIKGYI
jgi:uncharacterized SAM-binding protein YcdF (DUF218 family)